MDPTEIDPEGKDDDEQFSALDEQELKCPLLEEEEIALFEAKCDDIGRTITDVQQDRFIRSVRKICRGRMFNIAECGIGPVAMMIVEEVLLNCPQFSVLKFCL
jgi:hypothetical protein